MERQIITVDIAPGNSQVERLGSSQGDIGRQMGVYIIQNGVALDCSAYSAELYILKPDGKFYTTQATVDATETNLIKWETALQETPVAGACVAQIRITAGDDDIGTARFVEFVEASPCDMGSASESEVALLTEYVRQAHESAASAGRDATTASGAASSASGSASTATTAANTATQAATTATAAADRAEAVEESIPEDYSQLSDDVSGLKSAFEQLNDNVITESAGPAPIVSIADGADGMPMRKVEVAIEPVQDLHGYDSPWPAGGGKNLFYHEGNLTATKNGVTATFDTDSQSITISGTNTSTSAYVLLSLPITADVPRETPLCRSLINVPSDIYINFAYRKNGSWQGVNNGGVVPEDTDAEMPINIQIGVLGTATTIPKTVMYVELEKGSTAPTTYTPYSNICPITGWTGAKVTRCGKNLLPNAMAQDTSTRVRLGESTVGDGIRLKAGTYRISYAYKDGTVPLTPYWRTVKDGVAGSINNAWVIAIDEDINVRIWLYNSQGVSVDNVEWAMVELGSTATAYEPYQGQTYEVTFPTEAGTVYGGTLDVVSGKLTIDRAIVDLGSLTWTSEETDQAGQFRAPWNANPVVSQMKYTGTILCEQYVQQIKASYSNLGNGCVALTNGESSIILRIRDVNFSGVTSAEFATAMSGVQLCYEFATPVIVDLTAQEMTTLLGVNNVWSDTGDTAITYPADTKLYIDKKIAELQALILENNG